MLGTRHGPRLVRASICFKRANAIKYFLIDAVLYGTNIRHIEWKDKSKRKEPGVLMERQHKEGDEHEAA